MTVSEDIERLRSEDWVRNVVQGVRARDVERQLLHQRVGRLAGWQPLRRLVADGAGDRLNELFTALLGTALAFWGMTWLLHRFAGARPLYTLAAFGLFYSLQATYYRHRLNTDPGYRIPRCKCAGAANDHSERVLRSEHSAVFKVSNGIAGVAFFTALPLLVYAGQVAAAQIATLAAVAMSGYLAYVMVYRVRGLCSTCLSICTLNLLILWQLVR